MSHVVSSECEIVHVRRKGTEKPVGYIISETGPTTLVRWGVQDRRAYEERVPTEELEEVPYKIFSPVEVEMNNVRQSGAIFKIEGDAEDA